VRQEFLELLQIARTKLDGGSWGEAHRVLTTWYGDPKLTAEESTMLIDLLDQIAGTAIYSRQHLVEAPHTVLPGETLQQIAESYNVPPQLLAKINGIRDPQSLRPDQQLKVVRGPFHAIVRLDSHELTLMVNGCYAGRFPIGIGTDHSQLEGTYLVKEKEPNPTYYGPNGMTIGAEDPRNPLGKRWIGLGDQIGIHGTNDPQNIGRDQAAGSICLGDRDIEDVFDILSVGSRVLIQR
jgi:lipoprotein-anchoring transpeptidase ErfK/SrfK